MLFEVALYNIKHNTSLCMRRESDKDKIVFMFDGYIWEQSYYYKNYYTPSKEDMMAEDWDTIELSLVNKPEIHAPLHTEAKKAIDDDKMECVNNIGYVDNDDMSVEDLIEKWNSKLKTDKSDLMKYVRSTYKTDDDNSNSYSVNTVNGKSSYTINGKKVSEEDFMDALSSKKLPTSELRAYIPLIWNNSHRGFFFL